MKINSLHLFFLISFLLSFDLHAEKNDTVFFKVSECLFKFHNAAPVEKIYLHQDRSKYRAGETMWFKVYQSFSKGIEDGSGVVYVELIDGMNQLITDSKWKLENGSASGYIVLPDTLVSGSYQLRAYTKWMQNFDPESFFTREVTVSSLQTDPWGIGTDFVLSGNKLSAAVRFETVPEGRIRYYLQINGKSSRPLMLNLDEEGESFLELELPDEISLEGTQYFVLETPEGKREFPIPVMPPVELTLFPEGGNLVTGLPSKIAFMVKDRQGKGLEGKGNVMDDKGNIVRRFETSHLGQGYFYFTPEEGRTYTARLENSDVKIKLPEAYPKGIVADIKHRDEKMRVTLRHNLDTTRLLFPLYLTIHQDGKSWFNTYVDIHKTVNVIDIPKDKLPVGIFAITIYDAARHAYCERLAFVNYPRQLPLEVSVNREAYSTREKITVTVDAGITKEGDFSLAVVKANLDNPDTRNNFYSDYFLQSELKGKIENPASYFEVCDSTGIKNLDLLLLTHGWRRYEWNNVQQKGRPYLFYPVEKNLTFSGQVRMRNANQKPEDVGLTAVFQRDSVEELLSFNPTKGGAFMFAGYDFTDTTEVVLSAVDNKERVLELSIVEHDRTPTNYYTYGKGIDRDENTFLYVELKGTIPRDPAEGIDKKVFTLPEVSVTAKQKKPRDHRRIHNEAFNISTYEVKKGFSYFAKYGALGILYYVPGVFVMDTGDGLSVHVLGLRYGLPPNFVLDGFRTDQEMLTTLPATMIERVEVVGPTAGMIYGRGAGAILFFTRSWEDMMYSMPSKIVSHKFVGYNQKKEFYSPNYSSDDSYIALDQRNTLHWEPNVTLNKEGKAEVTFFTSDDKAEYLIRCEGRSEEGVIGVATTTFNTH